MGLRTMDLSQIRIPKILQKCEKPILEIRNLSLAHHEHTVLSEVDLCAAPGEIIGVIGHNGTGKSTFSRALCGLHRESTGTIKWNDGLYPFMRSAFFEDKYDRENNEL